MITVEEARALRSKWENNLIDIKINDLTIDGHIKRAASEGESEVVIWLSKQQTFPPGFTEKILAIYTGAGFDIRHETSLIGDHFIISWM